MITVQMCEKLKKAIQDSHLNKLSLWKQKVPVMRMQMEGIMAGMQGWGGVGWGGVLALEGAGSGWVREGKKQRTKEINFGRITT